MPSDPFAQALETARAWPGVSTRRMFGTDGLFVGAKVFALPWKGSLVLKVSDGLSATLLARKGVHLFSPMPGRRPSPNWVEVTPKAKVTAAELGQWARAAYDYTKAATSDKAPRKKKAAQR